MKEKILKKINKKIESYNRTASKWHYETLHLDEDYQLCGTFTPHKRYENASGFKGFFNGGIEAYRNGYLEGDFKEIQEQLDKYHAM